MGEIAFSLQESVVVYVDGRASCVTPMQARRDTSVDQSILGLVAFTDDRSVHADFWERHPGGDEVLCVLAGRLAATLDGDAGDIEIPAGQALIIPRGRWHRLRVIEPGRLLHFTPTAGAEHRPHAATAD
jgi:mannose-6-phosphate isomerase-like protein (cupin superfamily)